MVSQESIVNIEKIRSLELRGDYRKALEISQEIAEKIKIIQLSYSLKIF